MELRMSLLRHCMQYIILVDVPGPFRGKGLLWFDSFKTTTSRKRPLNLCIYGENIAQLGRSPVLDEPTFRFSCKRFAICKKMYAMYVPLSSLHKRRRHSDSVEKIREIVVVFIHVNAES